MRRQDRAITERSDVLSVLDQCDTIRVGFQGSTYPYVVPLSFGWEEADGQVVLYVHGAKEGMRHDLMRANPMVCVEADRCLRFVNTGHSLTCAYESVIGFGHMEIIDGEAARHGMAVLVRHCGFGEGDWNPATLQGVAVERITLTAITGKRRTVK